MPVRPLAEDMGLKSYYKINTTPVIQVLLYPEQLLTPRKLLFMKC